jgi:hypothetical protein
MIKSKTNSTRTENGSTNRRDELHEPQHPCNKAHVQYGSKRTLGSCDTYCAVLSRDESGCSEPGEGISIPFQHSHFLKFAFPVGDSSVFVLVNANGFATATGLQCVCV